VGAVRWAALLERWREATEVTHHANARRSGRAGGPYAGLRPAADPEVLLAALESFPQSVILCGHGSSAFNIKFKSLRLKNCQREETKALWWQHHEETGQPIDPAIFPELWEDTRGQPWLVNARGVPGHVGGS
jgi:hypothetical protein